MDEKLKEHILDLITDYKENNLITLKMSLDPRYDYELIEAAIVANAYTSGYVQALKDNNLC